MLGRKSGALDVSRAAAALGMPGIDPRLWISFAYVTAVGLDGEGCFADVTTLPLGFEGTARVGADYAGPGYGQYFPIGVDDEVLVGAPSGDPDHGLVILRRFHSPSDPTPQAVLDHPDDYVLVTKADASARIVPQGTGLVVLGDAEATDPAAMQSTLADFNAALEAAILTAPSTGVAALSALQTALATLPATAAHPGGAFPVCASKVVLK